MSPSVRIAALAAVLLAAAAAAPGCGDAPAPRPAGGHDVDGFCGEHGVAEARCPWCRPSLVESMGMCEGHGVPEALCSRCHPDLVTGFKAEKDWCAEHGIPESQCVTCHPELAASGPAEAPPPGAVTLETAEAPRMLRAPSPACAKERLQVRFASEAIAETAGLEFAVAELRPVTATLEALAEVAFDGNRHARLSSSAPATVEEIRRDLGETVAAGDVLAVLRSAELGAAKAAYVERLQACGLARERTAIAERLSRDEARLLAGEFLRAREQAALARRNLDREEGLLRRGAGTERDLLDARAAAAAADGEMRSLRRRLLLCDIPPGTIEGLTEADLESLEGRGPDAEKDRLAALEARRAAEAGVAEAAGRLRALGLTEEDLKAIEASGDTSGRLLLAAPFAGTVVERPAAVGEVVEAAVPLFEIADTGTMWALLEVREADARFAALGSRAVLSVEGLPGETFEGTITWVSARIDPRTRAVRARAAVPNPRGRLRAGMFGRAVVSLGGDAERLVVPKGAVQWEGCCNVVFVRRSATLFEPRKVRIGLETDRAVVIEEGLEEGEAVVTTGSFLLKTEILKGSIGAGCCGD